MNAILTNRLTAADDACLAINALERAAQGFLRAVAAADPTPELFADVGAVATAARQLLKLGGAA